MNRAKVSNEDRQRIVDAFEDGVDWQDLATHLNIKMCSENRWEEQEGRRQQQR